MLGRDQDRQHSLLVQVGEQLVYLKRQKAFLGHRLQIAVKAVDRDRTDLLAVDRAAHVIGEFAR